MRAGLIALLVLAGSAPGARLNAQGIQEVLTAIRNGGGWVEVPIVAGHGTVSTVTLPTMGLKLSGCLSVWEGNTGTWDIKARDTIGQDSLQVLSRPGRGVRFAHEFGMRSQVDFDFTWSEPRDTTLFLWVGLDRQDDGPDEACTPK